MTTTIPFPGHPVPHEMTWTKAEIATIERYAAAVSAADNAALRAEVALQAKQLRAANLIIASQDARSARDWATRAELASAAADVAGERAANASLTNEADALRKRVEELEAALRGLDEAYCRAGSILTRADRFEDRKRLIAARALLTPSQPKEP